MGGSQVPVSVRVWNSDNDQFWYLVIAIATHEFDQAGGRVEKSIAVQEIQHRICLRRLGFTIIRFRQIDPIRSVFVKDFGAESKLLSNLDRRIFLLSRSCVGKDHKQHEKKNFLHRNPHISATDSWKARQV